MGGCVGGCVGVRERESVCASRREREMKVNGSIVMTHAVLGMFCFFQQK